MPYSIMILGLIILLPIGSFARGPAVEPVSGISIDDYKEIPPDQAKGYHFQKGKPVSASSVTPVKTITKSKNPKTKSKEQVYDSAPAWPLSFLLVLLIGLPFGIWIGVMKSLGKEQEPLDTSHNTIAFPSKKSGDDDDVDWPKAG